MERSKASIRRCAIYTRKSSEEGLERERFEPSVPLELALAEFGTSLGHCSGPNKSIRAGGNCSPVFGSASNLSGALCSPGRCSESGEV